MKKKNKTEGITISDFKISYEAIVIKTVWYWHKNRHIDQWYRIEPRNKLMIIWSINLQKGGKNMQWEKDGLFNKWWWENQIATCKRMTLGHFLTPYTKINSKLIKNLNVRSETIKIIEESRAVINFSDNGRDNIFLGRSPEARATTTKINYWDFIKIKTF